MGFSKITDVAKQLSGSSETTKDKQQEGVSQTSDQKEWDQVGADAKTAFDNYQADQAQGKGPNYTEIGGVMKAAVSAYNRGADADGSVIEEQKTEDKIGKDIVAGLSGREPGEELKTAEEFKGLEAKDENVMPGESKKTTRSGMLKGVEACSVGDANLTGTADSTTAAEGDIGNCTKSSGCCSGHDKTNNREE